MEEDAIMTKLKVLKIISGGQTGADYGGLLAAKSLGIETGGWAPKNYRTENGFNLELRDKFNLKETKSFDYSPRTRLNIVNSDFTLIISRFPLRSGSKLTEKICLELNKAYTIVPLYSLDSINFKIDYLIENLKNKISQESVQILNVAGSRESSVPGIQKFTKNLIIEIFNG